MDKHKILVVDDEPHIRHVVASKLRNAGFEVIVAEDGREAYETARLQKPDLIVTDCQMPELSGLELCAKLRGDAATAEIPALILTARGFSLDPRELAATNIKEVIAKPFSPRDVLAKVQKHLGLGAVASA